ncbi:MAG: FkbM family methyltransferase, partial [Actinomycetes bacterium]
VGANIGVTSLLLGEVIRDGRILAVEAGRENCTRLSANLKRNLDREVPVFEVAMSDAVGTCSFSEWSAFGGIEGGLRNGGPSYEVEMTTLDDFVAHQGLTRLDLLKIDVEGTERQVLDGSWSVIEEFNPIVLIEFNAWTLIAFGDENPRAFLDYLLERFDFVAKVRADGSLAPIDVGQAIDFLHTHLTGSQNADDLVLRAKGFVVPVDDGSQPPGSALSRRAPASAVEERDWAIAHLEAVTAERDHARAQLERVTEERDRALAARDRAVAQRNSLRSSLSWKVTKPLRLAKSRFRSAAQ